MTAASTTQVATFGVRDAIQDFSGVRALKGVDFEMASGSVHGLVGENGCGKSTLIKIMTGAIQPTSGQLVSDGEPVTFHTPVDAQKEGVGVVHQDYNLFPDLSVAANVYGVSKPPPRRRLGVVDKREVARRVNALFTELRIDIDPELPVRALGAAERKFVEVARAMLLRPKFLILDEPTASLEPGAADAVLTLIEHLRDQGVGLAFVSHRLDEVLRICDRVTVLRDGQLVEQMGSVEGVTERHLAEAIIGRAQGEEIRPTSAATDDVALRVRNLHLRPDVAPVEFEVKSGEVFGLTGLLGSGAAEIVKMLGGAEPVPADIEINGEPVRVMSPRDARRAGIGFIPEDRKAIGLVQEQSIAVNISLPSLGDVSKAGWLDSDALERRADEYKDKLSIRAPHVHAPVRTLSGGNQQKVMLAKWLASGVRILAIEEPTHGIDIGAKAQVHQLLRELAKEGGSIIVASTDVSEVLSLCDRIGVMRHGRLVQVITSSDLSHADVAALGAKDSESFIENLIETGRPKEIAS